MSGELAHMHLKAELDWLWALLAAHLGRLQHEGILPADGDVAAGTVITPTELRVRLETRRLAQAARPLDDSDMTACERVIRALVMRSSSADWLPLERLREAFALDPVDRLLLLLTLGAELDPGLPRLYAFLQNHVDRTYPTGALLADILLHDDARLGIAQRIGPTGKLVVHGCVGLDGRDAARPMMQRAIRVEPRLVRLVLGERGLDPEMADFATLTRADDAPTDTIVWRDLGLAMGRLTEVLMEAQRLRDDNPFAPAKVVCLRGPRGAGLTHMVRHCAGSLGFGVLTLDLRALATPAEAAQTRIAAAFREATLQQAILVLEGFEDVRTLPGAREADAPSELGYRLVRWLAPHLARHRGAVIWGMRDAHVAPPPFEPTPETIGVPLPDAPSGIKLWRRFVPAEVRAPDVDPAEMATLHRVPPGILHRAVEAALARSQSAHDGTGQVDRRALNEAIKLQMQHRLGDSATLIQTHHRWDDLVVAPEIRLQLQEIVERYRQRVRVLEEWGLAARVGREVGMPVLFDGPPGTGKTMSATLIGSQLGLDVYQVDLSRMVSKWIGETEKNLARLFDEAERSRAILLFDEADSLFAKRTGVESSNDRYANLEVNFLLQRVEKFTGIAILTTNFPESIDEAFKRRITLRVTFERPGAAEREALWRAFLRGPKVPLADDVDFAELAHRFELTGGLIRNAALRAAFLAAGSSGRIDHEALASSAIVELRKHGTVVRVTTPQRR